MKTISPQDVHSSIASSVGPLVVCFLKAQGCPNCEQTKPVLAAMEESNPGTTFLSVTVADGSEVTPGFEFRMFPGVFSFVNGALVRAFSGLKTARQLSFMFSQPNDLKVAAWDAREAATFIERELAEYNVGCGYRPPAAAPVEAPAPGANRTGTDVTGPVTLTAHAPVPDIVDPAEANEKDCCQ